ncbi:MAG: hypothetical protein HC834_08020, partial [Rhodospirillales bacterium]|nr:hypothetical protein [Rhodospirillales bacterium]
MAAGRAAGRRSRLVPGGSIRRAGLPGLGAADAERTRRSGRGADERGPINCFGASTGTIEVTTLGGTAPYLWSWSSPDGFAAATEDLSGLRSG